MAAGLLLLLVCEPAQAQKSATPAIYRFYQSAENPNRFIAYGDMYGSPLFRSENGKDFRPLVMTGFAGNFLEHKLSFLDPFDGDKEGEWKVSGDKLVLGKETFQRHQISQSGLTFHPFPKVRVPLYFFQDASGKDFFVCISINKYERSRESLHFFIGPRQNLKEVKITRADFCQCGHIIDIATSAGTLYAEDTHFSDKAPKFTWEKTPLKKLDQKSFAFKENGGVSITPR